MERRRCSGVTDVSLPALVPLVEEALGAGLRVRVGVRGASMRPFVRDGDVVELVAHRGMPPRPGDLPLVRRANGTLVLHRVSRVGASGFFLRGDAQTLEEGPIAPSQVIALATGIVRDGRVVPIGRDVLRCAGRLWHVLLPVRPALLPAGRLVQRLAGRAAALAVRRRF